MLSSREPSEKLNHLTLGLLLLSEAAKWPLAKMEWTISNIYEADPGITCLCGQGPISNACILLNHKNGKQATVGCCCTKKFVGLPADKIFSSIKRIKEKKSNSLNGEAIRFALNKNWISQWEYDFSMNNIGNRKISEKQLSTREGINKKIILNFKKDSLNLSQQISGKN